MDEPGRILTGAPELGWSNRYVSPPVQFVDGGRDPAGWDCWGLVRWVYLHELGIELPAYDDDYDSVNDSAAVLRVFDAERAAWSPVLQPQPFDVAWIAILGHECHVGLMVAPGLMMHVLNRVDTKLARVESPVWQRRIRGYYRHHAMS